MSTRVLCVVYPGCQPYLNQFAESLTAQTQQDFEVLALNDGLSSAERHLEMGPRVQIRNAEPGGTPCSHRRALIDWALESRADHFVFADSDDYFLPNRVSTCVNLLVNSPIVVNELVLFGEDIDGEIPLLGRRFAENQRINAGDIREMNFLGLTNTAVRRECLENARDMPENDVLAFDWLLFSHLLEHCGGATFTELTQTYYRQYPGNVASIANLSDERIISGVNVKLNHFQALSGTSAWYRQQADRMATLTKKLEADPKFRKFYFDKVRKTAPEFPLWWEAIRTIEYFDF